MARHDYLPFGEEIWAGVGLRTTTQKYATTDKVRQRFALTERDEATGLDHTWFRKYDSFAGRWTSPDPLSGTSGDPQSFNLYSYTTNDPVNMIDPSGLKPCVPGTYSAECDSSGFGGWGWGDISGGNRNFRPGLLTILLRERMFDLAWSRNNRLYSRWLESYPRRWASEFIGTPFFGYNPQDPDLETRQKEHDDKVKRIFDDQTDCFNRAGEEKERQFNERIGASTTERLKKVYKGVLPALDSLGPGALGGTAKGLARHSLSGAASGFLHGLGFGVVWKVWRNSIPLFVEWAKIDKDWIKARVACTSETSRRVSELAKRPV